MKEYGYFVAQIRAAVLLQKAGKSTARIMRRMLEQGYSKTQIRRGFIIHAMIQTKDLRSRSD